MKTATSSATEIRDELLPIWMRQARQGTDWGVLLVFGLCLLLMWPLITRAGLPPTGALENHAYMAAEYARSFEQGLLYPRWTETAFNAYGAPIPHYQPPGVPYSAAFLSTVLTGSSVDSIRLLMIMAACLAGTLTYAFVNRFAGSVAGLLAASVYIFSPYTAMTVPWLLGDAPAFVAMALLPGLLWGTHRLLVGHRPLDFTLLSLMAAALILVNPAAVPAGLWLSLLLLIWHLREGDHKPRVLLVLIAWAFAASLSAFYWLPALLERDLVRWLLPTTPAPVLGWGLGELINSAALPDPRMVMMRPTLALGLPLLLLVPLAVIWHWRSRRWSGLPVYYLLGGLLTLLVAMLLQPHTHEWMGVVLLALAIGVSGLAEPLQKLAAGSRRWLLPLAFVALFALSFPAWVAPQWDTQPLDTSPGALIRYEQQGFGVAVMAPGEAVPSTLSSSLPPDLNLISGFEQGQVLRLAAAGLVAGRDFSVRSTGIQEDRYTVSAAAQELDVLRAHFAGWTARLNGQTLPLQTVEQTGLMRLSLPATDRTEEGAGQSANQPDTLLIRLEGTRVRQVAWALSIMALLLLMVGLVQRLRRKERPYFYKMHLLAESEARGLAMAAVACACALLMFSAPQSPLYLRGEVLDTDALMPLNARVDDGLRLLGYEMPAAISAGDTLPVLLVWQADAALTRNYRVLLSLRESSTNVLVQSVELHVPGNVQTGRWPVGRLVREDYRLKLPADLQAGAYYLVVEVYDCVLECPANLRRDFTDEQGRSLGSLLRISEIEITP